MNKVMMMVKTLTRIFLVKCMILVEKANVKLSHAKKVLLSFLDTYIMLMNIRGVYIVREIISCPLP